jgi:hypothetical protein
MAVWGWPIVQVNHGVSLFETLSVTYCASPQKRQAFLKG